MTSWRQRVPYVALAFPLTLVGAGCLQNTSGPLGSGDGGLSDGGGSKDGGESSSDGSGSGDGSQATMCLPVSTSGFMPMWVPPTQPQGVCSQAQLDSYGACLDSLDNNSPACAAWIGAGASANAGCYSCVKDSMQSDTTWGPLVVIGSGGPGRELTVAGCIALVTNDTSSTGCAAAFEILGACGNYACTSSCQSATQMALSQCITAAETGGCSMYFGPAGCVNEAGTGASACFTSGSYGHQFATIAAPFCLAPDGGT